MDDHISSTRKRSRSPYREHRASKRDRSRSPHHHRSRGKHESAAAPKQLPFQRQPLEKRDLKHYEALFAEYLDVQKRLDIDELEDDEVKGRWKSFMGKWNRGELAQGWYDPEVGKKVEERFNDRKKKVDEGRVERAKSAVKDTREQEGEGDEDDGYGPAPPTQQSNRKAGPSIPNASDLQLRRETLNADLSADRADLRFERKQDRQYQREALEHLAPRAEPGSKERQLEKKRETAAASRAFREAKSPGAEEVGDKDIMGDGEDEYKRMTKAREKAKTEREIRKEEAWRARAAEREEKLAEHRAKEDKTMEMLRGLARERFGA